MSMSPSLNGNALHRDGSRGLTQIGTFIKQSKSGLQHIGHLAIISDPGL